MSRVEFGYVDFIGRDYSSGRLTFFRTSNGRGRAFVTESGKRERIFQPGSFARACDEIADAKQVTRAFMINEFNMRGITLEGRSWRVEDMSGEPLAGGHVLDVFTTPHEIVHGLTVVVATIAHPSIAPDENGKATQLAVGDKIEKGFLVLALRGSASDGGNPDPPVFP